MELSEQAVDVTQLDLAEQVHSRVLASHYGELLEAVQDAARELGYFFAKAETAATVPELLAEVLAEAIVLRKEASLSPWNREDAEQRARRYLEDGFGEVMRDEMLSALDAVGVRLQETDQAPFLLTSAKIMRDEALLTAAEHGRGEQAVMLRDADDRRPGPRAERTPLRVDATKDEIVISGDRSLATYNWKPDSWGNAVKRLSIRAAHKASGDIEEKVFCVVATDGEDSGRKGGTLAEDLTESEALALIGRIQDAVKVSLGITQPAIPVVELPEESDRFDAGLQPSQPSQPSGVGRMVANGVGRVLSTAGLVVAVVAVLCALSFGLPVAYKAGQHFAAGMFPVVDAGDARFAAPYYGELLRAVPSARPVPHLQAVPPLGKE